MPYSEKSQSELIEAEYCAITELIPIRVEEMKKSYENDVWV
jgi:hypothetical protein